MKTHISAVEALDLLCADEKNDENEGLVEDRDALRRRLAEEGQSPYAVILTCSDSRVIPEEIFHAGPGELFVIRVAGNIAGTHQMASIDYAVSHLGVPLVVVLGHKCCGAVEATLEGGAHGLISSLTDEISPAVDRGDDFEEACRSNARYQADRIREALKGEGRDVSVMAMFYDIAVGSVEFI